MIVFLCENSEIGFYSAVFKAYYGNSKPDIITSSTIYQPSFTTEVIGVTNNLEYAARVKNAIVKYTGFTSEVKNIAMALKSSSLLKENICFAYVSLIFSIRGRADRMLSEIAVIEFNSLLHTVSIECHRFKGFMRFLETTNGVLYAHYEPDNDITELVAPHFMSRLNKPFIIHDLRRNKLALFNGNAIKYIVTDLPLSIYLSSEEEAMQKLWRQYFNSVSIESRPHIKQQNGYLPKRYRKHLPEFTDILPKE